MYIIGSLQLETRYSFIHAFILQQSNLWNGGVFWRGERGKKNKFLHCYWTCAVQDDYVKSVSVRPFLQSILCSLSGRVTLCETNKDRAASPSTTLWRLAPATAQRYSSSVRALSVLLGDIVKQNLKVSNSCVVSCLNISHVQTLQYSCFVFVFLFAFLNLPSKFITDFANVNRVLDNVQGELLM